MVDAACARGLAALVIAIWSWATVKVWAWLALGWRGVNARDQDAAIDFISSRGITRVGVFGVSLSGMLAHLLAAR